MSESADHAQFVFSGSERGDGFHDYRVEVHLLSKDGEQAGALVTIAEEDHTAIVGLRLTPLEAEVLARALYKARWQ